MDILCLTYEYYRENDNMLSMYGCIETKLSKVSFYYFY